jgi:uncharacterized protein (DUF1330 family)
MAKFVQIIEFESDNVDEAIKNEQEYLKASEGKRKSGRGMTCADRDKPGRYFVIVEFPSYEAAQENDKLPETKAFAEKQMKLAKGKPTFSNLDVLFEAE